MTSAINPASETSPGPAADVGSATRPLEYLRLLVVDDERDSRLMLRRVLEARGATVRVASSSDEAIQILSLEPFHVLISDIGLPGEDGYALMKRVRALPVQQGGTVPAIALTAYTRSEDRNRAIRTGFHMHLAKPVETTELVVAIASMAKIRPIKAD